MSQYTEDEKKYIAKKIEQYRLASLTISNSRSEGFSRPISEEDKNDFKQMGAIVSDTYKREIKDLEYKNYILNKSDLTKSKITVPLQNNSVINGKEIEFNNAQIKTYKEEIDNINKNGYNYYKTCDKDYSNNCIATATDNYKKAGAINSVYQSNYDFANNYKKYGFDKTNKLKAGDLKMYNMEHMVTSTGDSDYVNYAPGSGDSRYEKRATYRKYKGKVTNYTFTGTSADSTKWKNEYIEQLKNK